jgi:signal transduction histidine kinase
VELRLEMPVAIAPLATDEGKLQQVLVKLLGNALRYTPRGSVTVRLTTDPGTRRPTRIEVIDTGLGIPADRIATIFEAFEQADDGTSRRLGGTGLGLAISRSLCELMGYTLQVTSTPGAGSTFTIELGVIAPR